MPCTRSDSLGSLRRGFRPLANAKKCGSSEESGFTLVELVVVIILISLIATLAYTRVDSVLLWKQKEDLRNFASTWEFLFQHSLARGESYRLILDLDQNTYRILREIPVEDGEAVQVDLLKNLRTRGEQARRADSELEESLSSEEDENRIEETRRTGDLGELFHQMIFSDASRTVKLTRPPEFPELADPRAFVAGLRIKDVKTGSDAITTGKTFIRFSPRGASQFALVHFLIEEFDYTLFMNPSSGKVSIEDRYKDYEWTYGKAAKSR